MGEISGMFPETWRAMLQAGVSLNEIVSWWFQTARPVEQPYDFFLLKIDRVVDVIAGRVPMILPLAAREAELLRRAYEEVNEAVQPAMESMR